MSEVKRAYIFQGPGLARESNIEAALKSLGFEITHPFLMPAQMPSLELNLGPNDLLVLRGLWDMLPEEILYARQLGTKLSGIAQTLRAMPAQQRPTVIGVGRCALAMLFAGWSALAKDEVSQINWIGLSDRIRGPWIDVACRSVLYPARQLGQAVPDLPKPTFEEYLFGPDKQVLGWRSEAFLHLFFVDPLSLSDGSQLEGFGYENHEDLNNNTTFLRNLLEARHATSHV